MKHQQVEMQTSISVPTRTSIVDGSPLVAVDGRLRDDGPVVTWRGVYRVPRDGGTWYADVVTTAQYDRSTLGDRQRLDATRQSRVLEHCNTSARIDAKW